MEATLVFYCCEDEHLHAALRMKSGVTVDDQIIGPADDWPDLKAVCRDDHGRFAPCGGTNRPGGTGRTGQERREQAEHNIAKARELIQGIRGGPQPIPDSKIIELHNHLGTMTVAQMNEVKKEHGLKASGKLKRDLQAKLAARFAQTLKGSSPRPTAQVPKGTFGLPKGLKFEEKEYAGEVARALLGPKATAADLAACAGVPDGSHVDVGGSMNTAGYARVRVSFSGSTKITDPKTGEVVEHPYHGDRTLTREADGTKHIHNNIFEGKGAGLGMLGRQVENAGRYGFDHIDTHAAGEGGGVTGQRNPLSSYNGYYTWPRFGYNDTVSGYHLEKMPDALAADVMRHGGKVSGLMETKAGRDWWLGHGSDLRNATFDLRPGSYSQRTLLSNLKERGII